MPRVFPFVGLVFDPAVTGPLDQVTAPPYDVIGDAAKRACLEASPYNVVRLDLAEGSAGEADYALAGDLLRSWREQGALVPVPEGYLAYEMRFRLEGRDRSVRGVLCAVELEPWGGAVIPHERTMPGPVEDRLQLMRATRANLSAVYAIAAGPRPDLGELLEEAASAAPRWFASDEEGVEHRMWPVPPDAPITTWLAEEALLIADGHHRYATALHYREERRTADGAGPWDRVLALVVDAWSQDPPVLPFHRVVLRGEPPVLGSRVRDLAAVLAELRDDRLTIGIVTQEGGTLAHRVASLEGQPPTVMALHELVLGPELRAGEDVTFTPDAALAEDAVRRGHAVAAYFLPPTTPERIRAVIARGERLPQKSTFFWPKPRTGMVIRPLE